MLWTCISGGFMFTTLPDVIGSKIAINILAAYP